MIDINAGLLYVKKDAQPWQRFIPRMDCSGARARIIIKFFRIADFSSNILIAETP